MSIIKVNNDHILNEACLSSGYGAPGIGKFGFSYSILPLSRNLELVGNDKEALAKNKAYKHFVGEIVTGYCPYDKKKHKGMIKYLYFDDKHLEKPLYVYIQDEKNNDTLPLEADSVKGIPVLKPTGGQSMLRTQQQQMGSIHHEYYNYTPVKEALDFNDVNLDDINEKPTKLTNKSILKNIWNKHIESLSNGDAIYFDIEQEEHNGLNFEERGIPFAYKYGDFFYHAPKSDNAVEYEQYTLKEIVKFAKELLEYKHANRNYVDLDLPSGLMWDSYDFGTNTYGELSNLYSESQFSIIKKFFEFPSSDDINELLLYTNMEACMDMGGVKGFKLVSRKNPNHSIFIPFSGYKTFAFERKRVHKNECASLKLAHKQNVYFTDSLKIRDHYVEFKNDFLAVCSVRLVK